MLVALSLFHMEVLPKSQTMIAAIGADSAITTVLSIIIGAVTLTGSIVAFLKLQEWISGRPILIPGRHIINLVLAIAALVLGTWSLFADPSQVAIILWVFAAIALILGALLVIPIGGADMPVVISLLNSYSGLAAAMTGLC